MSRKHAFGHWAQRLQDILGRWRGLGAIRRVDGDRSDSDVVELHARPTSGDHPQAA